MKYFCMSLVIIVLGLLSGCAIDSDTNGESSYFLKNPPYSLGVWWWHSELISDSRYLDFAVKNGVDEIYLDTPDFGDEIKGFIQKANSYGIRVFFLTGDYRHIENDADLQSLLDRYEEYQNRVLDQEKFSGVHLDIEPHQHPDFEGNRAAILAAYLSRITELQSRMPIEIDIPFWFDDDVLHNGEQKPLYKALIDTVNRVFIMSYRDTAEQMYEVAKEEIEYAYSVNKPIMLGAETYSTEGDAVSYMEEGKGHLYEQLSLLKDYFPDLSSSGVAIHHILTWYNLKN